jgi:hypothetical protein
MIALDSKFNSKKLTMLTLLTVMLSVSTDVIPSDEVELTAHDAQVATLIALDSRLDVMKMFRFIDYAEVGDIESICELAEMTLQTNVQILASKDASLISKEDQEKNKVLLGKIDQYFKDGKCAERFVVPTPDPKLSKEGSDRKR